MKISSAEFGKAVNNPALKPGEKILPKDRPKAGELEKRSAQTQLTPLERGIVTAETALKDVPDIREDLVNDIKARIESGEYKVSGEEIAEMMLRRRAADRIR